MHKANRIQANRNLSDKVNATINYTIFYHEFDEKEILVYVTFTLQTWTDPTDRRRKIQTEIIQCVDTFRHTYDNREEAENSFHYQTLHCFAQTDSDAITAKLCQEGTKERAN